MAWTVWADVYDGTTANSITNTNVSQAFRPNSDLLIKAVRTWFVVYNDPVFTSLNAKIYATDEQSGTDYTPTSLIQTSDSRTKAQIHTEDYGVRETWFEFDPVVPLKASTWYSIVINGVGYSPTSNSYLAWKKGYPDPVLPTTEFTSTPVNLHLSPYQIYFIGASY